MHVAIDLGNKYTHLACWQKGQALNEACIRVRIPGMMKFHYTAAESFRNRNGMREYLYHLYHEYILPSRIPVDSAAISFPDVLNISARRMLLDVVEEILGLSEVTIRPQAIALVQGYNLQNPHLPLSGDIMVIQSDGAEFQFAFISIIDNSLTLEKQITGSLSPAANQSELNDVYSPAGWKLDAVLLTENSPYPPELDKLISLPKGVNIISGQNLQYATVDGLSWKSCEKSRSLAGTAKLIYPYEFYIAQRTSHASIELVKIPFDTVNLELECGGSYQLLTLDSSGIYNLANDPNRLNFRIYELVATTGPSHNELEPEQQNPIFEIDSLKGDLPARLRVYLHMASASLGIDLAPEKADSNPSAPLDLHHRLIGIKEQLYEILQNNRGQQIIADFDNDQLSANREYQDPLTDQINLTLLRLNTLLHLWHEK